MSSTLHQSASSTSRQRPDRVGARRLTVNLPLLLGTVALVAIALPALYFWYKYRADATATTFRDRAESLAHEGDHNGAVSYYQKYLLTNPDDVEALLGLIDAYSQGERNRNRLGRLNELIYRGLGRAPERHDLRMSLAENLLDMGAYPEASDEADEVLEASPEHELVARKVKAIAQFALSEVDSPTSRSEASRELLAVAERLPGDVRLVPAAAEVLRRHPDAFPAVDDAAERADELMNRLVDANPNNVEARLARCRYRLRYRLPGVEEDITKALEFEPEDVEAMILSAQFGLGEAGSSVAAREKTLRRVIDLAPGNPHGYLLLASILSTQNKAAEAISLLENGREMTQQNLEVSLALADAQLNAERIDEAKGTLAEIERESVVLLPHLSRSDRDTLTNKLRVIQARYAVTQGDEELAIAKLTSVMADTSASDQRLSSEWIAAAKLLARLHTRAGRTDQAGEYWDALSLALPGNLAIATESANTYLVTGNPQAAIQRIEAYARVAEPSPELLACRVRAHLTIQMARRATERNWTEFDSALDAAKKADKPTPELVFAEFQSQLARDNEPAAATIIRSAEELFADDAPFWFLAALAYQRLGEKEDMTRAIEKHKGATDSVVEEARLSVLILVDQQDFAGADTLLSELAGSASEGDKRALMLLRAEVMQASGDVAAALKVIEQVVAMGEPDSNLLAMGIEMALTLGKADIAQQWEEQLAEKTSNGFDARFARAQRLALSWDKFDAARRQQLVRMVNQLRADRPSWSRVVALSADMARLNGESRRALEEYQRAVELGDRRPAVLQKVVTLLYEAGRFEEVDNYMAMMAGDVADTPFFDMMAIEAAARNGRREEALELAKESVTLHPKDVELRLLLGAMLLVNDDAIVAVEVLQQAAKDFPNDNRVWTALFSAYVRSDQVDFARMALGRLVTSTLLPVEKRHFVAGQGYEIIGDMPKAMEQYKLAMAAQPSAVDVRVRYANLVSRQNPLEARAELEKALQLDPKNIVIQRQLAVLLATSGNEADWQQANQLLSATAASSAGDAATNDRLRAILLSQQGRTRAERIANCRLARDLIAPLLQRTEDAENDQNHRVMAGIFQREAALSGDNSLLLKARDEFREALDQGPTSAAELSSYIDFLLQAAQTLKDDQVDTANAEVEAQVAAFLSDADSTLGDLRRLQTEGDINLAALTAALEARLQLARNDKPGAEATIKEFVENHQDFEGLDPRQTAQRYLLLGQIHGVIDAHADAEQWYRRLMEQSPDAYLLVVESLVAQGKQAEAAKLGLEMAGSTPSPAVAKVLARIMTVTGDEVALDPAVEKALATAVESNQQDIELLQAEAVMRASRGDYAPAIATMRKILEINPKHALTLNNLATLLAERPNQRAEALDLIGRAIDVAGRNPMFLDTQGTIHLKLGDAKAAIASLEEATAGRATDARYYLHLAAAYELGGRDDDARRMLGEARAFGLENFVLTEDDRKMLTSLEESLASEGSSPQ